MNLSLKSTEEFCVVTPKNDAEFEEELTCALKTDMRNLVNFTKALNQKNLHFERFFVEGI